MTDADNTVIFSKGKSIITSDPDGRIAAAAIKLADPTKTTVLDKKNGVYTFDMWIPKAGDISMSEKQQTNYCSNYQNIGSVSDFAWLDDQVM